VRRCTAERRTPFGGNLAEGDPKGAQAGARPTRRSLTLQRNEPNESEVPYVRLETPNRKVSRGQVRHDSGSQHGRGGFVLRCAWVRVRKAKTRGLKNSKINIPSATKPALSLVFPAAMVGGQVAEYEITAVGGGGARYDTRICAIGGLYPRAHGNFGKAVASMVRVDALPSGAEKIAFAHLLFQMRKP